MRTYGSWHNRVASSGIYRDLYISCQSGATTVLIVPGLLIPSVLSEFSSFRVDNPKFPSYSKSIGLASENLTPLLTCSFLTGISGISHSMTSGSSSLFFSIVHPVKSENVEIHSPRAGLRLKGEPPVILAKSWDIDSEGSNIDICSYSLHMAAASPTGFEYMASTQKTLSSQH